MEYGGFLIVSGAMMAKVIKPKGKGSLPKSLKGSYTSAGEAMKAIDKRNMSNGKAK